MLVDTAAPLAASAQLREFNGQVDSIDDKKITVDNRKGDIVSFLRAADTVVTGIHESWAEIRKKDWVRVSWDLGATPRTASRIVTSKPKD